MDWFEAVILGIVEGLTEYLPVSSTGHLLVAQALMGIGSESAESKRLADAYAICIQSGAIVAVLSLYWPRMIQMIRGLLGRDEAGRRLAINIVVAFAPAVVFGLAFDEWIESKLFGVWPVVAAWFVGGVLILAVAWWRKARASRSKVSADDAPARGDGRVLEAMPVLIALGIGLAQCIAMWPGTSRSLMTIVAAVMLGMSVAAAVEFSFLLGVVTLCAATVKKGLLDQTVIQTAEGPMQVRMAEAMVHVYGWAPVIIGFIAAFISAVIAVRWMVAYLRRHGLEIFGYYRVAVAVVVGGMAWFGWLVV